jgi:hypothetical protein
MKFVAPIALATLAVASSAQAASTCNATDAISKALTSTTACSAAGTAQSTAATNLITYLAGNITTIEAVSGKGLTGISSKCIVACNQTDCSQSAVPAALAGCDIASTQVICNGIAGASGIACNASVKAITAMYTSWCTTLGSNAFGITAGACADAVGCYDEVVAQCKNVSDATTAAQIAPIYTLLVSGLQCNQTALGFGNASIATPASLTAFCDGLLVKPTHAPTSGSASAVTATLGSAMIVAAAAMFA